MAPFVYFVTTPNPRDGGIVHFGVPGPINKYLVWCKFGDSAGPNRPDNDYGTSNPSYIAADKDVAGAYLPPGYAHLGTYLKQVVFTNRGFQPPLHRDFSEWFAVYSTDPGVITNLRGAWDQPGLYPVNTAANLAATVNALIALFPLAWNNPN